MLSPSTSEGLSSKEMATCDSEDPVLICGPPAAPTSSLASTLTLASLCVQRRRGPQQALPAREGSLSAGPSQLVTVLSPGYYY